MSPFCGLFGGSADSFWKLPSSQEDRCSSALGDLFLWCLLAAVCPQENPLAFLCGQVWCPGPQGWCPLSFLTSWVGVRLLPPVPFGGRCRLQLQRYPAPHPPCSPLAFQVPEGARNSGKRGQLLEYPHLSVECHIVPSAQLERVWHPAVRVCLGVCDGSDLCGCMCGIGAGEAAWSSCSH